jgi:hypothetical protein
MKNAKAASQKRKGGSFSKPARSTFKRVATQKVNLGSSNRMSTKPQAGGPPVSGLGAAARTNKKRTGYKNAKSPQGWEAAAYTYTGNPPPTGSSDIYR